MAILKDLIVHGSSRFLNKIYANELETPLIKADEGIFTKLIAKDLTAENATVVGLLDVQGQLHTNTWTNSNIATIDGCFYITPTLSSDSGKISFSSTSVASLTGTYTAVTSLYIGDSSSGSTVQWTKDSKVLLTGEVQVNGQWLPLGTLLGTLSANATTSSIGLTGLTDNRHNTSSIITDIRNAVSNTSLNYRNLKISLYQRKDGNDSKPLGIYMTAMGANGKTFIDIYGGVNATTTAGSSGGFADPNLRIGNLSGLGAVEGTTPTGWGIYTTNGYFKGVIVSSAGKIGNFTINSALYSNNHSAWNSNVSGIYINNDGISGGAGGKWWLWNDGSAKIGAMTLSAAGVLTVPAANVSGELTAATINGSRITANSITAGQIAASAITADELAANAVTSAKIKAGEVKATNIASSAVTADKLDATTINASNKLTVGALTTTDQNDILNSNIQIGGTNLLKNSGDLTKWGKESGLTVTWDSTVNMYKVVDTSHTSSKWGIYQDLDIKPNTTYTFSIWGMKSEDTGTSSAVGTFASSLSWPTTNGSTYTTTMSRSSVTFTSGADHVKCRVYLYLSPTADNSKTGYFYRPKLEEGNKATAWSPAPEDLDVHKYVTDIDSNKGITIKPSDSSGNDYLQINSSAITTYRNNVDVMSLGDSSFRMGTASGKHTTVNSDGLHVWIGSESTAANEVGLFGSTARIGAPASSRFLLNADSLQAYNSSNVKYFEVSASGLSFGGNAVAKASDIPTTVAELTDSGSYLTTTVASNTYATQTNLNNEINARKAVYGTSSTDAGTATKAVTCSNFALYTGASVTVTFSKTNTSSAPQLNVNSTGAKPIKSYIGANLTEGEYKWAAGASITFTYDGTNWRVQDGGALQAKIDAASSASTASSQAGVATQQATNATNAKTAAESAKTAAESAKTAAQSAKTAAETASSQASSAKDTAVSAKNAAVSAKTDAETAKGQAQTAAGNASQSATNAANSATAAAEVMGGFTILWNYSAFGTSDNGEGYLCAFDPATGTKSDANGWVKWNGVKRTITKQMINPNAVLPYNIPIYVVCRLSSATATTGTNYMVWYNSGWKYAAMPTPSAVGGSWTWADNTDIILGKFVETASEAALTEYEIYNPPYTSKQITTNVVTAQSASASAANAAKTATNYIIADSTGLMIADVSDGEASSSTITKRNVFINNSSIVIRDGLDELASFGADGVIIGKVNESNVEITNNTMTMSVEDNPVIQLRINNDTTMEVFKETRLVTLDINNTSHTYVVDNSVNTDFDNSISISFVVHLQAYDGDVLMAFDAQSTSFIFGQSKSNAPCIIGNYFQCNISYDGVYTFTINDCFFDDMYDDYQMFVNVRYKVLKRTASVVLGATNQTKYYPYTVTEGYNCKALAQFTHAEGYVTKATGNTSHAEGESTEASGVRSHSEGFGSMSSGHVSHAEGYNTRATGEASHAQGFATYANGRYSHTSGWSTYADGRSQTVIGEYNIRDLATPTDTDKRKYSFIIGNGTSGTARSNALTVDWYGNIDAKSICTSKRDNTTNPLDSGILLAKEEEYTNAPSASETNKWNSICANEYNGYMNNYYYAQGYHAFYTDGDPRFYIASDKVDSRVPVIITGNLTVNGTITTTNPPFLWRNLVSSDYSMTLAADEGKTYTFPSTVTMPERTGYTRLVLPRTSNTQAVATGYNIDSNNNISVYLKNLRSQSSTVLIRAVLIYLKDDLKWT